MEVFSENSSYESENEIILKKEYDSNKIKDNINKEIDDNNFLNRDYFNFL